MAVQANETFSIQSERPEDVGVYGELLLRGSAEARASFRRGLDLSAGFDLRAEAKFTAVADFISASLAAGGSLRGGLALQAAFPLDLFNEAGIVARLRAQIEASAFVRASVSLELAAFRKLVDDALPGPALQELAGIFFDEIFVEAGVWGRAAFAVQIFGEAYLTGSLLPTANRGAGFSFSMRYGIGFIYGTGFEVIANFGIKDPHRLTDRMATALARRVINEAEAAISALPAAEAQQLSRALPVLRLIAPLAVRVPFQLGFELAKVAPAEQGGVAAVAALSTLARSALDVVLDAALDFGMRELGRVMGDVPLLRGLLNLRESERTRAGEILQDILSSIGRLKAIPIANMAAWLREAEIMLERASELIRFDILPGPIEREVRHILATAWSCARLIQRLQKWMATENRRVVEFVNAEVVAAPSAAIAGQITGRLGRPDGSPITLANLVDFVLQIDIEGQLREAVPAIGDALDWLSDALGIPVAALLPQLFSGLAEPREEAARAALERLTPAISNALAQQVAPVFARVKAANAGNEALAIVIDELVAPSLAALPQVFLPQIATLGTPEAGLRFREALSSVALQTLVRFLATSTDVLLAHGMREGEAALAKVGPEILNLAESHPSYAFLASAASHAVIPGGITPREASELVILGGRVLGILKDAPRAAVTDAIKAAAALGFATEATRNANLDILTDSDNPPAEQELQRALTVVKDGLGDVVAVAAPELLKIIALRPLREAEMVVRFVADVAAKAIDALKQAVAWLGEQIAELRRRLGELQQAAVEAAARMAAAVEAIANALINLAETFVDNVRAAGRSHVVALTNGLGFLQDMALALYEIGFDIAKVLLTAPLRLLAQVAHWVRETLSTAVEGGSASQTGIDEAVRYRLRSSNAASLRMPIRVVTDSPFGEVELLNLGTITIGAGEILSTLERLVLADASYQSLTQRAVTENSNRMAAQSQAALTSQRISNAIDQAAAQQAVADMEVGGELRIEVSQPADGAVGRPWIDLVVRIAGINRSYLAPVFDVPRRVVMTLNGIEQDFRPEAWQQITDEAGTVWMRYRARIVPVPEPQPNVVHSGFKSHIVDSFPVEMDPNLVAILDPADRGRIRLARATSLADLRAAPEVVGEVIGTTATTMWAAAVDAVPERLATGGPVVLPVRLAGQAEVVMEATPCCDGARPPLILRNSKEAGQPVNRLDPFAPDIDHELGWMHRGRFGCNQLGLAVTDGRGRSVSLARVFFLGAPES